MSTAQAPTPVEQHTPKPTPLVEVTGPSALAGGRRRFFDLLWLMAVTEFKRTYFGTVLGYLWSLMRPLLQFGVLLFVFTKIIKLGGISDYPVVLLLNIVLFTFFQEATMMGVTSVAAQEGIVRRTQFPRLVIPFSIVLTALFQLALNLIVVFIGVTTRSELDLNRLRIRLGITRPMHEPEVALLLVVRRQTRIAGVRGNDARGCGSRCR